MYPYMDTWPFIDQVYQAFGADRLLWGTGYPGDARANFGRPPLDQEIALIRDIIPGFSADDRAKILGRNAARVYGIDLDDLRANADADELSWMRAAIREAREKGWLDAD